jgi:prepilin-type N-terminal cleavage/methylation domain-containing protein
MNKKKNGFTIVEMAIVLLIVGLLLGGLMMPLTAQIRERRIIETQKSLDEIREALIGYAASQPLPHLPCPDIATVGAVNANDGQEDFNPGGTCVVTEGNIPWVTLGVPDGDAWGRHFHYKVTPAYSNRPPAPMFTLASPGTLTVCQTGQLPSALACVPGTATIATNLPAVILSFGINGRGAVTTSGALIPLPSPPLPSPPAPPSPNSGEYDNANLFNNIFVMHPPSLPGGADGEFDDQVIWLSSSLLNSRMIAAQKLP